MNIENYIEHQYRLLATGVDSQYLGLYQVFDNEKLCEILSTLHARITTSFESMNTRLPTGEETGYFWADSSRTLMDAIKMVRGLKATLQTTQFAFSVDDYYDKAFDKCSEFLVYYRGSTIPAHTDEVALYYTIPIFIKNDSASVDAPTIKVINHEYIRGLAERTREDIERSNYDSAITKCRTLLEEVFCYVIEVRSEQPSEKGDIGLLYKQVKDLYGMHNDKSMDKRINTLLSGLNSIISAVAEMRNKSSDAHGIGIKRINIDEHHARLFMNTSIAMADFILAVGEKHKKAVTQ